METTEQQTGKLAEALAKAQGMMRGAEKDKLNPHFKSRYADLASVWDACREALSSNGLSVVQLPMSDPDGVTLVTILLHASGESIRNELWVPVGTKTPQGYGSAITYARRYSLAAMVGVAAEDDDGNEASSQPSAPQQTRPSEAPKQMQPQKTGAGAAQAAHRARIGRLWAQAKSAGVSEDWFRLWMVSVLGEEKQSSDLTIVDITKLEGEIARLCKHAQDELDVPQ